MMRGFKLKRIIILMSASMLASNNSFASAFQIWEQDATSVGNYHAGRAALANDASTAFLNPAGITRIKNQQMVFGGDVILTNIKYTGTVAVNTLMANRPQSVTAQGGNYNLVPFFYYVAPLSDKIGLGLSVNVPFGLRTTYGRSTLLRYASSYSSVQVVDISPSFGFNVNDKLSLGAGLDIQKMSAEFDLTGVLGAHSDTDSTNKGFDTAYGFHVGGLYQFNEDTRVGLTFNSQVVHHLRGTSKFEGPIANTFNMHQPIVTTRTSTNITMPPYTTLSMFRKMNPSWAVMGTVIYTRWSVINSVVLQNVSGIAPGGFGGRPSNNITVTIPQHYRNTWNLALGADYYATDKITLRSGVGYDQTPTNNSYRTVQVPDSNRYAIALGGHFQATKTLGFDIGWTHIFLEGSPETGNINPPVQVTGVERVTTHGSVNGNADVYGAQLTWDIT